MLINSLALGIITLELSVIFQLVMEEVSISPVELLASMVRSRKTGMLIPDSKSILISTLVNSKPSMSSGNAEISCSTVSIVTSTVSIIPVTELNHKVSISTSMAIESFSVSVSNSSLLIVRADV